MFETPLHAHQSFLSPLAIDNAGITTILGATNSVDLPAVHPIASCTIYEGGYLVRLDDAGNVIQSSFLPNLNSLGFYSINAGTNLVTAVLWHFAQPVASLDVNLHTVREIRFITLTPQPNAIVTLSCAGNGATFQNAPLAPGEVISLFGSGIGPATPVIAQSAMGQNFPTHLSDTEVTFNGCVALRHRSWHGDSCHSGWGSITGLPLPAQDLPVAIMVPSGNIHDQVGVPADAPYVGPLPSRSPGSVRSMCG